MLCYVVVVTVFFFSLVGDHRDLHVLPHSCPTRRSSDLHDRLDELVPIEPAAMPDRQVIEWDKDDIDALKFMKVDCLALGMLTAMKRGFDLLAEPKGITMNLASIPPEAPRTYAMIRAAATLGAFQIERAEERRVGKAFVSTCKSRW